MKFIYTRKDGGISIVIPAPKVDIERTLGPITNSEYELHVLEKSIPAEATNVRKVQDSDFPNSREFRNAWCDVTESSQIDIDCTKAKQIGLEQLRRKRNQLLNESDKDYLQKVDRGLELKEIKSYRQNLRDITEPLKALDTTNKVNDEIALNDIRSLASQLD